MGGEKTAEQFKAEYPQGSPPRGRGKEHDAAVAYGMERITPAWAGKSHLHPVRIGGTQDHPRVGGEKAL